MNGVARQFWAEVFDIRTPLHDDEERERRSRSYRKTQRKVLTRRGGARREG